MSDFVVVCETMRRDGFGWEDVLVVLAARGLAREQDAAIVRRFVLGTRSGR